MKGWKKVSLGDLTQWFSGGTPSKSNAAYWNGDIPWISARTFKSQKIYDSEVKISEEGLANGSRLAEKGDILLLVRGSGLFKNIPVGIVESPVAFNQDIKAIRLKEGYKYLSPYFLLIWLESQKRELYGIMEETAIGAGKFDLALLKDLVVHLPPRHELELIVSIFRVIDAKIDLLRRQNETLEKLARLLFKRWFVDFEFPWDFEKGAFAMDGKPYRSSGGKMVASELGEIPKGWRTGTISDLIEVNPRVAVSRDEEFPYVEMKALSNGNMGIFEWYQRPFSSGSKFQNGDTLLARITPCLENGKTAFVNFLENGGAGWGSTEFLVLRAKKETSPYYVYCMARSNMFRKHAILNMTGSSGRMRVPNDVVRLYEIPIPPQPISDGFGRLLHPIFSQIKNNQRQSKLLTDIRDLSLPNLVQGKLQLLSNQ